MRIIAVASQKGGAGKTTLSGHLAVQAEREGAGPVALIDTDPQGSLAAWWNARDNNSPSFAHVDIEHLEMALETLAREDFQTVIIDTPPALVKEIDQVVTWCDLAIVPTRPGPHDLRAVGATVDMLEARGKPLIFVVNGATARARLTSEAAIALSQHGVVAPTIVHNRQDFAASMIDGRTVMECDAKGKSAKEIAELWSYIDARLARQTNGVHYEAPNIQSDIAYLHADQDGTVGHEHHI